MNYLIHPTFNKLFVLLFENEDYRTSFSKYYTPKVEIKDFNLIIDGKRFFDVSVENKEKHTKKYWSKLKRWLYNW